MLEFFRRNLFINSILLLPFCLLLRIKGIVKPVPYVLDKDLASTVFINFYEWIGAPWLQGLVASLFIYIQALIINRLAIKHRLSKELTPIPGLIFITISAVLPDLLTLSPQLIGASFIIIAVSLIFETYNSNDASGQIFSSGFLIGLAGLFYFPYYYFFIFSFIGLIIMKSFTLKERIQHVIAWVLPTFLLLSFEYFVESSKMVIPDYFGPNLGLNNALFIQDVKSLFISILIGLLILVFVFNYSNYNKQKPTATQKKISILYWVLAYTGFVLSLVEKLEYPHIALFLFPSAIFIALSFLNFKNKIIAEIAFLIMLIFSVIVQFDLIQI